MEGEQYNSKSNRESSLVATTLVRKEMMMTGLGLWQWHGENDRGLQFILNLELIDIFNRLNLGWGKGKNKIKYDSQIYVGTGRPVNFQFKEE